MTVRTRRGWTAVVAAVLSVTAGAATSAAQASVPQPTTVSQDPVNYTPNAIDDGTVSNSAVNVFAQVGSTMYAGGKFHTVQNAARTTSYTRDNVMSFNASTGAMTTWNPATNGEVWALAPYNGWLYVGGTFTTIGGQSRRGIAKVNPTTGAVDPTFNARFTGGGVTDAKVVGNRLIVSGYFPKRLAALDLTTGSDTGYLNLSVSGTVASNAGATQVYRFAISPDNTKLVGIGNFTSVGGQRRYRAFMANLGTTATLASWYYQPLEKMCAASSLSDYMRDVDFSPDGSYFAFASTGYVPATTSDIGVTLCDAAARFETNVAAPARPTWINYTGGDTLHSVAVTGSTVYVGGHQRWLDNPYGRDSAGVGAVSRPGIGAIDPTTGKATSWNPTKTRGVGTKELYATNQAPAGLWVGSDGDRFHGEFRAALAFCPL